MGMLEHIATPFRLSIMQRMYEGIGKRSVAKTLPTFTLKQNAAVWFATAYLLFAASPTIEGLFPYPLPGDALDGGRSPLLQA